MRVIWPRLSDLGTCGCGDDEVEGSVLDSAREWLWPLLIKLQSAQNPQYLPLFLHARQDQINQARVDFPANGAEDDP